ncbi:MAG TPA: 4Fe-4S dicluster domain-containing protein [Candidatus Coprenecus stercoripullorum]|nr:4Fe-4S dicluster domain-containing protein [Candidatus Coprenecus stercoripullorum]
MGKLYERLMQDYRLKEGLKACINCGTCTAVCPAAEFYRYNPKNIVNIVQSRDDDRILELLKSDMIWYCGECMSCVTRCPRTNAPGMVIIALRSLSVELGYFVESEKGRQQYALAKVLCGNILNYGYCVHPETFKYASHPEYGTVGKWIEEHLEDVYDRVGANYRGDGPGPLRKIAQESLDDLKRIFDVTGATARVDRIKALSLEKAKEMGLSEEEYFDKVFNKTECNHLNN